MLISTILSLHNGGRGRQNFLIRFLYNCINKIYTEKCEFSVNQEFFAHK